MLIVEVSRYVLSALMTALIAAFEPGAAAHLSFKLNINLSTWVSIFVLIVLAEVFREGARMKEEQELTV